MIIGIVYAVGVALSVPALYRVEKNRLNMAIDRGWSKAASESIAAICFGSLLWPAVVVLVIAMTIKQRKEARRASHEL